MEVSKADHVLHSLDGGRVHGLDPPLRGEPGLLAVIVHHLDLPPLGSHNPGSYGHIKLPSGDWLYPDVVALKEEFQLENNDHPESN